MGFIFEFGSKNVLTFVQLAPRDKQKKMFKYPNIFYENENINNLHNIMFFDLESDGIVYNTNPANKNEVFIPNIREWSFVHLSGNFPYRQDDLMNAEKTIHMLYKTHYSYADTINAFWYWYQKLNYPVIIAHNGRKFDFLLLIANVYRYLPNAEEIVLHFKFFDSYVFVKDLNIVDCSNVKLFLKYLSKYKKYENLQYQQHQSLPDCQMMALWLNEVYKIHN